MKSSKNAAYQIGNLQLTEAIRNALGVFVNVVLVEVQKTADKKAEAVHSLERAASKRRMDEMAATIAALTKTNRKRVAMAHCAGGVHH
jgi:hypothetical protein